MNMTMAMIMSIDRSYIPPRNGRHRRPDDQRILNPEPIQLPGLLLRKPPLDPRLRGRHLRPAIQLGGSAAISGFQGAIADPAGRRRGDHVFDFAEAVGVAETPVAAVEVGG